MKFTEFLTESKEGKNVHLEHLEDNILNGGVSGAREAINFLRSLRDMLAGHTGTKMNVTTKILQLINGIIFKNYDVYPNMNFKKIVDELEIGRAHV